jgi:predicted Fe-Mo cluster-binding NifX family protein
MDKLLISSSGDNMDAGISDHFAHSAHFLVVNTLIMDYDVFPGVSENNESTGINRFAEMGITKLLTGDIDRNDYEEAISAGMDVYLCPGMTLREAIRKVSNEEIEILERVNLKDNNQS